MTNVKRLGGATVLFLIVLTLLQAAARAAPDPLAPALTLYHAGRYDDSVAAAKSVGSAAAHALAARALLAKAVSEIPYDQRLPVLRAAEAEADAAIAADDAVFEGHMQKLVAFGEIQRMSGDLGAAMKGAAGKSHKIILRALEIEPNSPWALAALGGWHLEIVRRAPLGVGKVLYGASRSEGIEAFEKALQAGPSNALVHYEFGMALLSLDAKRYRAKAEEALNAALAIPTEDAFTRFMQKRAVHLLALVGEGDHQKLDIVLAAYRGETPEPS